MMGKIFLSYSRKQLEFAQRIHSELKEHNIWIDIFEVEAGDEIIESVSKALEDSHIFIIILSKDSLKSNWVSNELRIAITKRIEDSNYRVIPVLFDKNIKVPSILSGISHIDAAKDRNAAIAELRKILQKYQGNQNSKKILIEGEIPKFNGYQKKPLHKNTILMVCFALITFCLMSGVGYSSFFASSPPQINGLTFKQTNDQGHWEYSLDLEPALKFILINPETSSSSEKLILPFLISKYEVSLGQFLSIEALRKYKSNYHSSYYLSLKGGNNDLLDLPLIDISWNEGIQFCRDLSELSELEINLPTVEQWQYAAGKSLGLKFPWGDEIPGENGKLLANYSGYLTRGDQHNGTRRGKTALNIDGFESLAPISKFEEGKSPYGVFNMAGNVWEWCLDDSVSGSKKIIGGGYNQPLDKLMLGKNFGSNPKARGEHEIGLRLVINTVYL